MKPIKIAISGYGRIGRLVHRRVINDPAFQVVAINASYAPSILAHLLKYDTVHGTIDGEILGNNDKDILVVNGQEIKHVSERDPAKLPWKELEVDVVIEATGAFRTREGAQLHIDAGAKKVLITAPAKGEDITIVIGVNEDLYDKDRHHIVSNASCTTNCLAPVVKVLHDKFGVEQGLMTTVHAYTNDQNNLDNPHKDLRRARACMQSIIPTSTGAASAVAKVIPELAGKLNGLSLRVPTPNVSVVDLVVDLKVPVTAESVNEAFAEAAGGKLKGILGISNDPLVSIDYNGEERSGVVDGLTTMTIGDKTVKVFAWYDNEWGYSCRVVDLARLMMA